MTQKEICKKVMSEICRQNINNTKLAQKAGICANTMAHYAQTASIRIDTLIAVLDVLGFELTIVDKSLKRNSVGVNNRA